ncbi:uncharacterized protein LOC110758951 isoform X2 [Prunus avium]|uniref:Uncharacterized protein LOC110758951 isoform X2 n=1 Tax=Prunus avium TaxID=42229 RepID=A0A6P5SKL5_PRUAV|nr:uncharacterized protein LOC110758951 isoform X2 [Prunus avium]
MTRNSGVLIRQLLGNRNNPCAAGLLHHLHQKPIQNLTSVPNTTPSSPHTIDIRSASKPFSNYSIHTPNLQFLQQRRCLSPSSLPESDSDSKHLLSGPSNLFVVQGMAVHQDAVDNVKRMPISPPTSSLLNFTNIQNKKLSFVVDCLRFSTTLHPGAGLRFGEGGTFPGIRNDGHLGNQLKIILPQHVKLEVEFSATKGE